MCSHPTPPCAFKFLLYGARGGVSQPLSPGNNIGLANHGWVVDLLLPPLLVTTLVVTESGRTLP